MNLLLFVVRYGEPPSLGMLARWRRNEARAELETPRQTKIIYGARF